MIQARFDDLRSPATKAWQGRNLSRTIETRAIEDVRDAVAEAETAAASGSWVAGFVAYEAGPAFDPNLATRPRPEGDPYSSLPLVWFGVFDERVEAAPLLPPEASFSVWRWEPSVTRRAYDQQIEQIREYIRSGETYQVNHTLRLRGEFAGTDKAFYAALALAQRGGHCAYLDTGRYRILSASPELFFRLEHDGTIVTRPMKGTASRGRWPAEDRERAATLLATEKERAENAMIVDLLRNDLGRIAEAGSVEATALFDVERYETVWQMTSTVQAKMRDGLGVTDIFGALFPSGSVTGAPKVRSMQIIAKLETLPRGVYCGAVGWIAPPGAPGPRAEFNVAIRTVVLDPTTQTVEYGVGGGITYDSVAAREYAETVAKARVLTERRPEFELLETIGRTGDGSLLRLEGHLDRLEDSAGYFGFAFDRSLTREAIERATKGHAGTELAAIRLTLARDGTIRTQIRDIPTAIDEPVSLAIDDTDPVDADDVFLFHKTTLRGPYERRAARLSGADDVLLTNRAGEVTETTIANVAAKLDGVWVTPSLTCGLLPGVERAALLADGAIQEGRVSIEMAREAEELAVFNSVRGWRPAHLIDS